MLSLTTRPFHSLDRKLPLLMGGLVVVLVLAALAVTRYELRSSALAATDERLDRVSAELAEIGGNSLANRRAVLERAAAEPAVTDLLTGVSTDVAAARVVLQDILAAADSTLPTELRDRNGLLVATTSDAGTPAEQATLPDAVAGAGDSITYTPIHASRGRAVYWVSVPVRADGEVVGHIHQQRSIGNATQGEQIAQLFGDDSQISFANQDGSVWVGVDGELGQADASIDTVDGWTRRRDSETLVSHAAGVPATPWVLVAETPLDVALARANAGMRRLMVVGGVLLVLGCLAAWLVSRSVTVPLRRLAADADAIAGGDYTRRTGLRRPDEIGLLASSFDEMVERVEFAHAELGSRFAEARSLAGELELANERLQQVVRDLDAARVDAQQASRAKSEFLATMSHEIRTPINAMIGYADLLDMGVTGALSAQQQEYMDRIRRSGEHLIALVNDVLDFAKVESGQMRIVAESRPARPVIDAALSMMHAPASKKGVVVDVSCGADTQFLGDPQRVKQIVLNLLSNALKFSERGGHVRVSCTRRDSAPAHVGEGGRRHQWTCITVSDDGPGIDEQQREAIFEPFVQGTSGYTRPHGGTGLGLAISRSLARLMGGDLTLDSAPGESATFTLWLPHAPAAGRTAA